MSHDHDTHEHHHHHDAPIASIPRDRQAVCPVTGDIFDKVEAEKLGHVREYEGKKYYFCCATCVKLFANNPKPYTENELSDTAKLTLKEKEQLTDNVWAFRFEPSEPLTWTPGQFIFVELPHDNPDSEGTRRFFTVSSIPSDNYVQITARVTQSTFKQALASLPIGGELHLLDSAQGDFVWDDENERAVVFIAGGIGITPFWSMLKQRKQDGVPLNTTLIYANRTAAIPFKEDFDTWAAEDKTFIVHYLTGQPMTAEKLREFEPALSNALVYISGPEPMIEALGKQLKESGLDEEQLKQDFFPNYHEGNY